MSCKHSRSLNRAGKGFDGGFTLIEVLVAVLIFGLIATAASEVASNYIGSFERIRDKSQASWIAQNRMAELQLLDRLPGISERTERIEFGRDEWRIDEVIAPTPEPRIRRVELTVYRMIESEPRRQLSITGFLGEFDG